MVKITEVVFTSFRYRLDGIAVDEGHNAVFTPGGFVERTGVALQIRDSDGVEGSFVYPSPEQAMTTQAMWFAKMLIGRDPNTRQEIYDDLKRISRKLGAFGYSPLDIALWDMAGKRYDASITTLLGGFRTRLPTYASTFHGDRNGRAQLEGSIRRLCRILLQPRLPRLQDTRLDHDGPARGSGERPACCRKGRRPHGPDARSRVRACAPSPTRSMLAGPATMPNSSGSRIHSVTAVSPVTPTESCARRFRRRC